MADIIEPINFLRESLATREIILSENNKELIIKVEDSSTPLKLPIDHATAWTRSDGKGFYTVGALWFWFKNRHLRPPEYVRAANEAGMPVVLLGDREDASEYLAGKKPRVDAIDEKVRGETMIKRSQMKTGGRIQPPVSSEAARKRDAKADEKRRERKV